MEYFDWLSVPQVIISYFGAYLGGDIATAESAAQFTFRYNLICVIAAAGLYLLGLVMGGIGLYTIAKHRKEKGGALAFLPFGNTYVSGEFAGEGNMLGKKIKRIGLWAMLVELVFVALKTFNLVANMILISRPEFYAQRLYEETGETYFIFDGSLVSGEFGTLSLANNVIEIISYVWWFALIFFFCTLYFAFFRKYYARNPFLMTFLCSVIPCRGFVLFAVRHNTPLDYNEYIRRRMAQERRRYEEQYGGGGGQGTDNTGGSGGGTNGSPFPDFDGTGGSGRDNDGPFSDFKN